MPRKHRGFGYQTQNEFANRLKGDLLKDQENDDYNIAQTAKKIDVFDSRTDLRPKSQL